MDWKLHPTEHKRDSASVVSLTPTLSRREREHGDSSRVGATQSRWTAGATHAGATHASPLRSILVLFFSIPHLATAGVSFPDRDSFLAGFLKAATGEISFTTTTIEEDRVILHNGWLLTPSQPDFNPEPILTGAGPQPAWLSVEHTGDIHGLLLENQIIPDPRKAETPDEFAWLSEMEWWMVNEFYWPAGRPVENQALELERAYGVTGVWLNGQELGPPEYRTEFEKYGFGEHLSAEGRNRLAIRFAASKGLPFPHSDLPQVLLHRCGIEGAVRIAAAPKIRFLAIGAYTTLSSDRRSGTVELDLRVQNDTPEEVRVHTYATLRLPDKPKRLPLHHNWGLPETVKPGYNRFRLTIQETDPVPWWPVGMGQPYLYPARIQIRQGETVLDNFDLSIGFRSVEWSDNGTLLVNNRPTTIRGTAWDGTDLFQTDLRESLYRPLEEVLSLNLNAVWVRNGGRYESPSFYDACDRGGVLVFQECPLRTEGLNNQHRILDLERHTAMAAWVAPDGDTTPDSLANLEHHCSVISTHAYGEPGKGIPVLDVPALPHRRTFTQLLGEEVSLAPSTWSIKGVTIGASIPVSSSERYRAAIQEIRLASPACGQLMTGAIRALWPGMSPALTDVMDRPTQGFWAVRKSWEPKSLILGRAKDRFEAWVINSGLEPISGAITVFDALQPEGNRRSVAPLTVPSGSAALVWSSTPESWSEQASKEGDLKVMGGIVGEPFAIAELTRMALGEVFGKPVPVTPQDPRLPHALHDTFFCAAASEVELPTAELHVITFAEDTGPWRATIRSFGKAFLHNVRLEFDPPDAAEATDQVFDIPPDSARLVTIRPLDLDLDQIKVTISAQNAEPVTFYFYRRK